MAERFVRDIYHKGIIFCQPDASLQEVVVMMAETDVHAIIVAAEAKTKPLGVILHINVIAHYGSDLTRISAREAMQKEFKCVSEDTTVAKAAQEMVDANMWRLLVIGESGEPLGVISTTDIIRSMRASKPVWYNRE